MSLFAAQDLARALLLPFFTALLAPGITFAVLHSSSGPGITSAVLHGSSAPADSAVSACSSPAPRRETLPCSNPPYASATHSNDF